MVGSLITSVGTPAIPFELGENFGLGLGIEDDSEQYQLYADQETALFVVRALNRTHGGNTIGFPDVFRRRVDPSGGFQHVSYVAWLNAGYDIVPALTSPCAVEGAEDAAAQLLEQMSEYGEDLLREVTPEGTRERLFQKIHENTISEVKERKNRRPRPEDGLTFENNPTFASLYVEDERPVAGVVRAWLESHISPLSLAFWRDPEVFINLTEYRGALYEPYEEPEQPEVYRLALEAMHERAMQVQKRIYPPQMTPGSIGHKAPQLATP